VTKGISLGADVGITEEREHGDSVIFVYCVGDRKQPEEGIDGNPNGGGGVCRSVPFLYQVVRNATVTMALRCTKKARTAGSRVVTTNSNLIIGRHRVRGANQQL